MQKIINRNLLYYTFILSLTLVMKYSICDAQTFRRKGKSEVFGLIQQMSGDTTSSLGVVFEVDSFTGLGLGAGYNFNENLNLNLDIFFSSTDITGNVYGIQITGDSSVWGYDLNLDVNILKNKLTPMITGGIGFINFSGDFVGYEFNETDFSYNFGFGIRWDATDHLLIKGLYRSTWTKIEDTDEKIILDGISVSLGYIF